MPRHQFFIKCFYLFISFPFAAMAANSRAPEAVYSRTENSMFTIEVHSGNRETKSALGSGYLVSSDGKIATNFHVIEEYAYQPERNFIRVKNKLGEFPAQLWNFDLVNDLALLQVQNVKAKPLPLFSKKQFAQGSAIVSLGNPMGFNLSIIRGLFNGYAEKGLIDRMLLSMPLNSGMSGGPILNEADEVIGTNVSIIWLSNSLSFGVPVAKLGRLLQSQPLTSSKEAYRQEIHRQALAIETETAERIKSGYAAQKATDLVQIGEAELSRPPNLFDCWDSSKSTDDNGISRATYSCNLQFTPTIGNNHEIASVELFVEHLATKKSGYGFYDYLSSHSSGYHMVGKKSTRDDDLKSTAPECVHSRVRVGEQAWKINTCINAYADYPKLYDFALVATTLNRSQEAILATLHMHGFLLESFDYLSRLFLERIHFREK